MGQFVPTANAETINFSDLKSILLSKDMEKYALLNQMTRGGKCLLLDGSFDLNQECDKVSFCSFARSGNTFLRCYLEQVTGVFTGADMNI